MHTMYAMIPCMQLTFVQLASFVSRWKRYRLTDDDLQSLEKLLGENPQAGDVIRGGAGLRKVRFAPPGRGKSGAYRVAYAYIRIADAIYLFTIFAKKDQANLTAAETVAIRKAMVLIRLAHERNET
jgi:hypothetical protein